MSGYRANSYGGNDHGDQPFTADRSIPNTTTTPILVGLNNQFFNELSRTAQWFDWDQPSLFRLDRDFYTDHLNHGPYVPGQNPPSMPADYWNPGYIPISGENTLSDPVDYCVTLPEDGFGLYPSEPAHSIPNYGPYVPASFTLSMPADYWNPDYIPISGQSSSSVPGDGSGLYPMNLNTGINGADANLRGKNHSNVKNSYISAGSALDNNEPATAVKYSLNAPYNPTVGSPCSKGASASEPVSLQVVKKPKTSDKSNGRAPKLTPMSYGDGVKLPTGKPDNASKPEKYYAVSNESVDEVVVEGILASKDSHTSETGIEDVQVTKNGISGCSCMSCHVQKNDPTKDSKFLGKEPVSSSTTRLLIDTMHNLSELLLHHCSSETCELSEQDLKSLEKVVDNLNTCVLKNIGRESGINIEKHTSSKDATISVSVESGSDMTTNIYKSDQAINVLTENLREEQDLLDHLFNNLLFKVEARCDNLKMEMEKCKPDNEKDVDEHSVSELDGIHKLATEVKDNSISDQSFEDSLVSLPGTACNSDSYSDDDDDEEEEEEVVDDSDEEDDVFHSITLADCSSDWEFVSEELSD